MGGTDFSELLRKIAKYASNRRGQLLTIFVLIFIPTFIRRRRLAIAAAQSRAAVKGGEAVVKATPKTTWLAFSEFLQNVETGNVSKVLLDSNVFTFILKEKGEEELFKTRPVSMHLGVVDLLHSKGVTFDQVVHRPPGWTLGSALVLLLPIAYLGVIAGVLYKFYDQTGGGEVGNLNDPNHATNDGRRGKKAKPIRFEDVAGADAAKGIVEEVSDFLRYPEKYEAVGARLPTGILLVGPPGTGKTMLAKAIATEAGLPFFYCSGSDFVEVFAGRGAARVRKLFQKAERAAPSMIFFDEIDALGRSRSGDGGIHTNEEREQTLNQLLSCMDGFSSDKRVVVMAATNRFDVLDRALTRPGRFDRVTHVELPDEQGREAILKVHVRRNDIFVAPDTDFQLLAALSEGLAGADLAMIVNEAAIRAARDLREVVVTEDFLHALDTYKTSRQRQSINGISFIDSILKGTTQ